MTDEKARRAAIAAAGFNPDNHPSWATVEWLLSRKAEAREAHQRVLDQFRPSRGEARVHDRTVDQ